MLLHGLSDWYRTWMPLAPGLAHDRRVLLPDLPGHGLSGRPDASYALHWYAQVMTRWLDAAGVEGVDLVGHSFGGGVAQMMLLLRPERVRRLVLVSAGGLGREVSLPLRMASLPLVVEHLGQRFMGPGTRLALRATGGLSSRADRERLVEVNALDGSARALARTVRDIIDWRGQHRSFFQRAGELRALPPMAVFWGDRDAVIPFAHAEALVRAVEGVRLTRFEGCGHYPHHEKPEGFVTALRAFLDAPDARRPRLRRDLLREERAGTPVPMRRKLRAQGAY